MTETPDKPPFQLHLEPDTPLELGDLTATLSAIARQFEAYALEEGLASRGSDAKLLVSSVRPGSIDIGLLPDVGTYGTLLAPFIPLKHAAAFALKLKALLDKFRNRDAAGITVRDCDDAGAIVNGIAKAGGSQTFNIIQGDVYAPVLVLTASEAREITHNSALKKAELQFPNADTRQRVAMIWDGLDRAGARKAGKRSPDKGLIEEIDGKPRPVFFEDEFSYLKGEMLDGEENPYRKIYFVDVIVSHVGGRVASYKIIGFHGTDERDDS